MVSKHMGWHTYQCSVDCPGQHRWAAGPWRSPQLWRCSPGPEHISPATQDKTVTWSHCMQSTIQMQLRAMLKMIYTHAHTHKHRPILQVEVWVVHQMQPSWNPGVHSLGSGQCWELNQSPEDRTPHEPKSGVIFTEQTQLVKPPY